MIDFPKIDIYRLTYWVDRQLQIDKQNQDLGIKNVFERYSIPIANP